MYMFDLRPGDKGQVTVKLTYNGEERVLPPEEGEWDTDIRYSHEARSALFHGDGKVINGWIGVLRRVA